MAKVASAIQTINKLIMKASFGPSVRDLSPEARVALAEWLDREITGGLMVALRQLGEKGLNGKCCVCQKIFPLHANKVVMHKENPNALEPCRGSGFSPLQVVA